VTGSGIKTDFCRRKIATLLYRLCAEKVPKNGTGVEKGRGFSIKYKKFKIRSVIFG